MDLNDIRIETWSTGFAWTGIRMIHCPTGERVQGNTSKENPSQHKLRMKLRESLRKQVEAVSE